MQWLGRAEVRRNGEWGTICDNGFDELEGNIICRRLGYGTVKKIVRRAGYSRGVGKIHYTQIRLELWIYGYIPFTCPNTIIICAFYSH